MIASVKKSDENSDSKTSIKLVATNLIANGKIYGNYFKFFNFSYNFSILQL